MNPIKIINAIREHNRQHRILRERLKAVAKCSTKGRADATIVRAA